MANILVLFESNNRGYTKSMAHHIEAGAQLVSGNLVKTLSVEDATIEDLRWMDGIALGSPTNLGGVSWRMKQWWDQLSFDVWEELDGKIGCSFSSSGANGGGAELTCMSLNHLLMNFGIMVFGVPDYVDRKMAPHYGAICAGEPRTDGEIAMCTRLGRRLSEWSAVYVDGKTEFHPKNAGYSRGPQH
jgi:NAD(P)H dehydrogenase (quinone)